MARDINLTKMVDAWRLKIRMWFGCTTLSVYVGVLSFLIVTVKKDIHN